MRRVLRKEVRPRKLTVLSEIPGRCGVDLMQRICKGCGMPFETDYKTKSYCSAMCQKASCNRKKHRSAAQVDSYLPKRNVRAEYMRGAL